MIKTKTVSRALSDNSLLTLSTAYSCHGEHVIKIIAILRINHRIISSARCYIGTLSDFSTAPLCKEAYDLAGDIEHESTCGRKSGLKKNDRLLLISNLTLNNEIAFSDKAVKIIRLIPALLNEIGYDFNRSYYRNYQLGRCKGGWDERLEGRHVGIIEELKESQINVR